LKRGRKKKRNHPEKKVTEPEEAYTYYHRPTSQKKKVAVSTDLPACKGRNPPVRKLTRQEQLLVAGKKGSGGIYPRGGRGVSAKGKSFIS